MLRPFFYALAAVLLGLHAHGPAWAAFNDCTAFQADGDGNAVIEMLGEVAYDSRSQGLVGGGNAEIPDAKPTKGKLNKTLSVKGRGGSGEVVEVQVYQELELQRKGQFRVYAAKIRVAISPPIQEALGLNRFKGICVSALNFTGLGVDQKGNIRGVFNMFPRGSGAGFVYVLHRQEPVDRAVDAVIRAGSLDAAEMTLAALTRPGECNPGEVICAHDAPGKLPGAGVLHAVGAERGARTTPSRAE